MRLYAQVLSLLAAVFLAPVSYAITTDLQPITQGQDYTVLKVPEPVETGSRIEVVEFFWYRCPHCNHLRPALEAWAKKLPKDVQLRYVPAVFNDQWQPGAKILYALQDVGALDKLHDKVFEAYHVQNINLNDQATLFAWIEKQGVDRAKFEAAYKSFSVQSRVMKGAQAARDAGINGVPALMVDGKYVTSQSQTITEERLFETLDYLIKKARLERSPKSRKAGAKPVARHK
ncbi:MAG TPA: thiol:disulfide interchange protein DsbA/DsbL [Thiobacillaceae bacterium]|nr:thiol:disulfide interchange protein DsbA/DsbL [Thiobacillaceae bacterium]